MNRLSIALLTIFALVSVAALSFIGLLSRDLDQARAQLEKVTAERDARGQAFRRCLEIADRQSEWFRDVVHAPDHAIVSCSVINPDRLSRSPDPVGGTQ